MYSYHERNAPQPLSGCFANCLLSLWVEEPRVVEQLPRRLALFWQPAKHGPQELEECLLIGAIHASLEVLECTTGNCCFPAVTYHEEYEYYGLGLSDHYLRRRGKVECDLVTHVRHRE
jgi:hypothetical protein